MIKIRIKLKRIPINEINERMPAVAQSVGGTCSTSAVALPPTSKWLSSCIFKNVQMKGRRQTAAVRSKGGKGARESVPQKEGEKGNS